MSGVIRGKRPLLLGLCATACALAAATSASAQEEATDFDCARAGHLWEDATKEELRDPKLHLRSTKLYFSQGAGDPVLYVKAARSAELAVHLDPSEPEYHMRLGMAYAELKCYAPAGNAFAAAKRLVEGEEKQKRLASDIQNNTQYYWSDRFRTGVELMDEGSFEAAVGAFESAIAVDSTDARAYSNLGVAYHSLERYNDAITAFESALKRDPTDDRAKEYYRLTQSFVAGQAFSEALGASDQEAIPALESVIGMYKDIMKQDPPDVEIADYEEMMGQAERSVGERLDDPAAAAARYDTAVEHFRAAALARHRAVAAEGTTPPTLATDPDYLGQILNCFVASADWDSTMHYGQTLVDLDPRNHRAYVYLGEALRNTNKQNEALTYFLVAQCLNPERSESVDDINNHFVGLLSRYKPTDDIVTASIQNLESPGEIRVAKQESDISEAWFFWEKGFVDCYYNGQSAGKVEFAPTTPEGGDSGLHGEALSR